MHSMYWYNTERTRYLHTFQIFGIGKIFFFSKENECFNSERMYEQIKTDSEDKKAVLFEVFNSSKNPEKKTCLRKNIKQQDFFKNW